MTHLSVVTEDEALKNKLIINVCDIQEWFDAILSMFKVWMDAGSQILASYSLCAGLLQALGSFNKYNNDSYK